MISMRVWLKNLREEKRLSRQEMANMLELDIEYYELLENGNLPLNIPVLLAARISEFFAIPISRLVIYEGEYKSSKNVNEEKKRLTLISQAPLNRNQNQY